MQIKTIGSGSDGNCYHVSCGDNSILLDAGISFKKMQKAINFKTSSILGVLVGHEHIDHAGYIKDYIKNGLDIYLTAGTKEALQLPDHYRLNVIDIKKSFNIAEYKIMAFDTVHDAKEPCGYIVKVNDKKLLYATDTKYIKYNIPGVTHIMLEANYEYNILKENVDNDIINKSLAKRITESHMSLDSAIDYLNKMDNSMIEKIIVIHLSKNNAKKAYFKERLQKEVGAIVEIASDKKEY